MTLLKPFLVCESRLLPAWRVSVVACAAMILLIGAFTPSAIAAAGAVEGAVAAQDKAYSEKVGESPRFSEADPRNLTERSGWKRFRAMAGNETARETSVVIIFFLVATAFLLDFAARRGKGGGPDGLNVSGGARRTQDFSAASFSGADILLCAIPLVFLATRYFFFPWDILFIPSEDIFFPTFDLPANIKTILAYLVERPARPMVPFRILLSGLFMFNRSVAMLRALSFIFAGATMVLVYVMVRRHTRGRLAAVAAAAALPLCPGLDYGLIDLRGYTFAAFFTILSVFFYIEFLGKRNSLSAFLWMFSLVVAITSYPSSIAVAGGMFIHYVFFDRSEMPGCVRRIAAAHFLLVGLCIVLFIPMLIGNIGHKVDRLYDPGCVFPGLMPYDGFTALCVLFFAAAFGYFRKSGGGVIMFSAAAGSLALLALMCVAFVFREDRYLLFVLPLNMVSLGIAADGLISSRGGRSRTVSFGILVFAALMFATPVFLGHRSSHALRQYLMETRGAVERISAVLDRESGPGGPVIIYPQEFFYTYLSSNFDFNDLRTRGSAISMIKETRLDGGGSMRSFGDVYTSWPPVDNPSGYFGKPVKIIIGYRSVLAARATISRMRNFQVYYEASIRQGYSRDYPDCTVEVDDESFVILSCGLSPAHGGERGARP